MSSKKLIKNAYELVEFIRVNAPSLYNHQWEMDGDLNTFSISTIFEEAESAEYYYDLRIDGRDSNYVPAYYGCGTLSRALAFARGHMSHKLFRHLGLCTTCTKSGEEIYDQEKAESMASWSGWY